MTISIFGWTLAKIQYRSHASYIVSSVNAYYLGLFPLPA